MGAKYLVWNPDNYIEFITVKKDQPGGNGTAVMTTQEGVHLAKVVCDGNGLDVTIDGKTNRLTYADLDYIVQCHRALEIANQRKEYCPKFYEMKAVGDDG